MGNFRPPVITISPESGCQHLTVTRWWVSGCDGVLQNCIMSRRAAMRALLNQLVDSSKWNYLETFIQLDGGGSSAEFVTLNNPKHFFLNSCGTPVTKQGALWIPALWLRFEVQQQPASVWALSTLADFWRDWKSTVSAGTRKCFRFFPPSNFPQEKSSDRSQMICC